MNLHGMARGIDRNSTHILTGAAVLGFVGTVVLAVRATPGVYEDIHELRTEHSEGIGGYNEVSKRDILSVAWRPYLPAALLGAASIACIVSVNAIGTRRQAGLAAGAAITQQAFKEYRETVIKKIGQDKEEEVRADIVERKISENPPPHEVIVETSGQQLFFDTWSNRYFYSTIADVHHAVNEVNFEVINNNYATMNDFWRELGLPQISMGDEFGFTTTNKLDIYLTAVLTPKQESAIGIDYHNAPIGDYTNPFHQ